MNDNILPSYEYQFHIVLYSFMFFQRSLAVVGMRHGKLKNAFAQCLPMTPLDLNSTMAAQSCVSTTLTEYQRLLSLLMYSYKFIQRISILLSYLYFYRVSLFHSPTRLIFLLDLRGFLDGTT